MMMHCSSSSAFLALFAVVAVAFGPSQTNAACSTAETGVNDIVSIACAAANAATFGTLCTLLQETGLDEALDPGSDYFVFAPTNAAFAAAGRKAGVTISQKAATLKYHVSIGSSDLVCGNYRDSILVINGFTKQSQTVCTGATLNGQVGVVRLPFVNTDIPEFTPTAPGTFITACNGVIAGIDQVMGYGQPVYDFGVFVPCSFNSKSCKGSKGGLVVATQTVDGVVFNNIYRPKKAKHGKWSNLNQFQSIYANNALDYFGPYVHNGNGGYYGHKHNKKAKNYGYYNNYNNFGGLRGRGRNNKRGKKWKRNRNLEAGEFEGERGEPSAYEPNEYHYDDEDAEEEEYEAETQ